jgi:hypothetical protein
MSNFFGTPVTTPLLESHSTVGAGILFLFFLYGQAGESMGIEETVQ